MLGIQLGVGSGPPGQAGGVRIYTYTVANTNVWCTLCDLITMLNVECRVSDLFIISSCYVLQRQDSRKLK